MATLSYHEQKDIQGKYRETSGTAAEPFALLRLFPRNRGQARPRRTRIAYLHMILKIFFSSKAANPGTFINPSHTPTVLDL